MATFFQLDEDDKLPIQTSSDLNQQPLVENKPNDFFQLDEEANELIEQQQLPQPTDQQPAQQQPAQQPPAQLAQTPQQTPQLDAGLNQQIVGEYKWTFLPEETKQSLKKQDLPNIASEWSIKGLAKRAKRNYKSSATGILQNMVYGTGLTLQELEEIEKDNSNVFHKLFDFITQIGPDIPTVFSAGAIPGAAIGGKVGTAVGGPAGGVVGAAIGAGATSFYAREAIRQSYKNYLIEKKENPKAKFTDYLGTTAKALYQAKGAAIDGALIGVGGQAARALGIPAEQALKAYAAETVGEVLGLQVGRLINQGKFGSIEDMAFDTLLIALLKGRSTYKVIKQSKTFDRVQKAAEAFDEKGGGIDDIKLDPEVAEARRRNAKYKPEKQFFELDDYNERERIEEIALNKIEPETKTEKSLQERQFEKKNQDSSYFRLDDLSEKFKDIKPADLEGGENQPLTKTVDKIPNASVSRPLDIIRLFNDNFAHIFEGKIKQPPKKTGKMILGYFKPKEKSVRLYDLQNIETAAHEIGHAIDWKEQFKNKTFKTDIPENIQKEIDLISNPESKREVGYLERQIPQEQYADFFKSYVTDFETLKNKAPNAIKHFENVLNSIDKSMKPVLEQARQMHAEYKAATPQQRVKAHIHTERHKNSVDKVIAFTKDMPGNTKRLWRMLYTKYVDQDYPLKTKIADAFGISPRDVDYLDHPYNAYRSIRLLNGYGGKVEGFLNHYTFDYDTLAKTGKSLKDILSPLQKDPTTGQKYSTEDFNKVQSELSSYLTAKRAVEYIDRKKNFGISLKDAEHVVKELAEKYEPIAKEINQYQKELLTYARKSGFISKKQQKIIEDLNKDYVPIKRVFDYVADDFKTRIEGPQKRQTGRSSGRQAQQPIKRLSRDGSTRSVYDPLESIFENTDWMIKNAERNRMMQTVAQLSTKTPNGIGVERVPIPKKAIKVSRSLVEEAMRRNAMKKGDPVLQKVIELFNDVAPEEFIKFTDSSYGPRENIVKVFYDGQPVLYEVPDNIMRSFYDPGIQFDNFALSVLRALARFQKGGILITPQFGLRNFFRDWQDRLLYTRDSKSQVERVFAPFKVMLDQFRSPEQAKADYVDFLIAGGSMGQKLKLENYEPLVQQKAYSKEKMKHKFQQFNELLELGNRMAEYNSTLSREKKGYHGRDDTVKTYTRESKEKAAFAGRDISIDFARIGASLRSANMIINFTNARVQGLDKLLRTATGDRAGQFYFHVTTDIILPTILEYFAAQNDKEIAEIPDEQRDNSYIYRIGKDNLLTLPVPFETGIIFHGATRRLLHYMKTRDPKAFDNYLYNVAMGAAPSFIPSGVAGVLEIGQNYDKFRKKAIVPLYKKGELTRDQYGTYTSETSKLFSGFLEKVGVIDKYNSTYGAPAALDHLVYSWSGPTGRFALQMTDKILEIGGRKSDEPRIKDGVLRQLKGLIPFFREFPNASAVSIERYYENYEKAQRYKASMNDYKKRGKSDKAKAAQLDAQLPSDAKGYQGMRNMQQAISNLIRDPSISDDEKRPKMRDIYRKMIEFARAKNKAFENWQKDFEEAKKTKQLE